MYSARATQPSLADTIATPSRSCATVWVSPGSIYIWLPPIDAALSDMVTSSSRVILPLSTASIASSIVITFVTDAGGSSLSAFKAYMTLPVAESMSTAAFAFILGPPFESAVLLCDTSSFTVSILCATSMVLCFIHIFFTPINPPKPKAMTSAIHIGASIFLKGNFTSDLLV